MPRGNVAVTASLAAFMWSSMSSSMDACRPWSGFTCRTSAVTRLDRSCVSNTSRCRPRGTREVAGAERDEARASFQRTAAVFRAGRVSCCLAPVCEVDGMDVTARLFQEQEGAPHRMNSMSSGWGR